MCAFAPAFVFLSHRRDATVLAAFRQFASAAARRGPVHFLYHDRGDTHALPWHLPAVTFQDHDLGALGLPTLGASVVLARVLWRWTPECGECAPLTGCTCPA